MNMEPGRTMMTPPVPPQPPAPEKKRRRPALACEQCRRRKIRCDRKAPCGHCVRSGITSCSYAPTHIPASWAKKGHKTSTAAARPALIAPAPRAGDSSTAATTAATTTATSKGKKKPAASTSGVSAPSSVIRDASASASASAPISDSDSDAPSGDDWLADPDPVHRLEDKLSRARVFTVGETHDQEHDTPEHVTQSPCPINGTVAKTRYFGRSHWMNGTMLFPIQMEILTRAEKKQGELAVLLGRCKTLGRTIKEHRFKPLSTVGLGRCNMPARDLADVLVEGYLRTFEGILRILHVPSFRAEYERYWLNPDAASDSFCIQLQLAMALGAAVHDDTFSLRASATQWIYEAQMWLMLPPEKSRMTVPGIQIMCLLTLARSVCAVGQDLVWVTAGGLVRNAMHMGLHRDPRHLADMTTFRAEMRRRLWATVLELNLQSSFDAGGPPLISALDYDTKLPANLNDDQLGDEPAPETTAAAGSDAAVTQMSLPLEMSKSLPLRLSLLRHANDFRAVDSYDETLRVNSELTKACRCFSQSAAILTRNQQDKPSPRATDFHAAVGELLLYRCFHTLHQPVISRSLDDPRFYFSRKMYLDGALKMTHICGLSGPRRADGPGRSSNNSNNNSHPTPQTDLDRLMTNASGLFRNSALQSLPALVVELVQSRTADGESGLGLGYLPALHDYDLRATVEAGLRWTLRRIRSGETNIKAHCFLAACLRQIDAVEAGLDRAGTQAAILRATEEAVGQCLEALRDLAEREGVVDVTGAAAGDRPAGAAEGEQQMPGAEMGLGLEAEDMAVDFTGYWAWDDMNDMDGLLWGSPRPFDDHQPPIFA